MRMKKRIYIAGCGGMLGEAFYQKFKTDYVLKCTDIDVNESWLSYLDFRNRSEYFKDVTKFKADYIFHLGAFTDLEYCEKNVPETYDTNTLSVENAVHIARELNIPILYISTAGIFDGGKNEYDDWDSPNPLGHYARSKYAGEMCVVNSGLKHLVCRAGWMMGGGPQKDKKFVNKIMLQLLKGVKQLHVVNDKDGTPTYTHDFALNVKALLEQEYWGLYNMVCAGLTSRLEVATELVNQLGIADRVRIEEVNSDYFASDYFAERPLSERLINAKLSLRNSNLMSNWKSALTYYMKDYYAPEVAKIRNIYQINK
jgi:dTDP-4-dehydrorhamnose reductase